MIDDTTTGRGYPKPHPDNLLSQDVNRLRAWADGVDGDIVALNTALADKVGPTHTHTIEQVSGLTVALGGMAPAAHSHNLGSLTDVSVIGAAPGAVLKVASGGNWTASQIAMSDVTNLTNTLAAMQLAIETMDDGNF